MKTKQKTSLLKQLLVILMVTVMVAGISVVGASAADTKKTYLWDMNYHDLVNYSINSGYADKNGFQNYEGGFCTSTNNYYNVKYGKLFKLTAYPSDYPESMQNDKGTYFSVSYDLNGKYNNFKAHLLHDYFNHTFSLDIICDDKVIYSTDVSGNSPERDINVDTTNAQKITFKISFIFSGSLIDNCGSIVLDNAYFTNNGSTPEPPTDPTPSPTEPTGPTVPTDPTVPTEPTDPTPDPTVPPTGPTDPTPGPTVPPTGPTGPTTGPCPIPTPTPDPTDPTPAPTKPATPDNVIDNKNGGSSSNGDSTVGKDGKGVVATGGVPFVTAGALATVALGAWITMLVRRKFINK